MSGISTTTVQKIDKSTSKLRVNSANLDAMLIAMATRAPLASDEIGIIVKLTGRRRESIETLNKQAEGIHVDPETPLRSDKMDLTPMERLAKAFKVLEDAGQAELALAQIELLASTLHINAQVPEENPPRRFSVTSEPRTGEIKNAIVQDINHYQLDDEGNPVHRSPSTNKPGNRSNKPSSPKQQGDYRDCNPGTGTH